MRIFLSYSSDDRPKAEEISLALEGAGPRFGLLPLARGTWSVPTLATAA
jgi:hypothetical protein